MSTSLGRVLGTLTLMIATTVAADEPADRFEKSTFRSKGGGTLPYRFLLPPADALEKGKVPLVVFLHGAGERGTDNTKQLVHGVTRFATDEMRKKHPCVVVAPQCPDGKRWVEVDWSLDRHTMPDQISDPLRLTMELIDEIMKERRIDADRVYITGLSMGGYGTWDAIQRSPEKFAAAVPVCGGADHDALKRAAKTPVWAFHGAKDTVVKPHRSRDAVAALRAAGAEPKYTEYADVSHNSWVKAYETADMYEWLFEQRRTRDGK